MNVTIKFTNSDARSLRYFLREYFNSKAELPVLVKMAVREIAAKGAEQDLEASLAKFPVETLDLV